jgi:dinuclear metal center YbgI/SA1388 family protein
MLLHDFHTIVQRVLPPESALPGDAIGLQVESLRGTANQVLVALELTDEVLQEAVQAAADVVLVFHPLVYRPLAAINNANRVGRLVSGLIRSDIALIVVHTTFDVHPSGTSVLLAQLLDLAVTGPLVPSTTPEHPWGIGVVATATQPNLTFNMLVERVAQVCGGTVRYSMPPSALIQRVAIVGGSGMHWIDDAIRSGADVFITADVKYHDFHAAVGRIGLLDPGHYEMEHVVPEGVITILQPHLPNVTLTRSSVSTNPVRYHSPLPLETPTL